MKTEDCKSLLNNFTICNKGSDVKATLWFVNIICWEF